MMVKPKEYAKKFSPWKKENHNDFTETFRTEVISTIETVYTLGGNRIALARMRSLAREAREKFDRIREFIPEIPESIWGYVYASAIKPTEKNFCAAEIKEEKAERKRKEDWENSWKNPFGTQGGHIPKDFFETLMGMLLSGEPKRDTEAETFLDLSAGYSKEDVSRAFKKKAFAAHPDHGGSHSSFLLLTEMKNRAIRFAK